MKRIFASAAVLILLLSAAACAADEEMLVPGEDDLWAAAGRSFVQDKDKAGAMQQYQLFLNESRKSPRAAAARFMLAECYFFSGDSHGALMEYEQVFEHDGRSRYLEASVLLRTGECLFNLGRFDEAVRTFNTLLADYSGVFLEGETLFDLGQTYVITGDWEGLERSYEKLLESRPGYRDLPAVKFALGVLAYQAERYDEAIALFEDVKTDRGLYFLGRCYDATGQYILAIQRFRQAQRRFPDSPLAEDISFSIADAFYDSGQNRIARRSYKTFIEEHPESRHVPTALYKLACISYREKAHNDCIRQVEDLCDAHPEAEICAEANYLAGLAWMDLERPSHAIFSFTEVVKRFPDNPVASAAMHKIIYAYVAEENYNQAVLMAKQFFQQYPGDHLGARVGVLKGFSHYRLEEYELAIRDFQNVMDQYVNTDVGERALFLATTAYFDLAQFDRLITNYHFIANRLLPTPSDWRARTYYYLGEAYYAQGLYREAVGMFRLVLTGYPRSNVAVASLQGMVAGYSQMDEYDLALAEQEKFLLALANADSEEGENSLAVGSLYFNQHKYEDALQHFTEFLEKHPDGEEAPAAMLNQGDCYYRLQYYEQAVAVWKQLIADHPDAPEVQEAVYRVADTEFGLGEFAAASGTYKTLLSRFPEGAHAADAAFGIANCHYNLQADDAAIAAFGAFLDRFPEDARVEDAELGIQSCFYRSGRDIEEYVAQRPDSPMAADFYWTKGQDFFAEEKYEAAAKAFEKVTLEYADSESSPGALFYLAESYYRMEQLDQALAGFRNFATTNPDHELAALARFRAGTVLFKQESFETAATTYELLTEQDPGCEYAPLALFNAALCYQELEDWPSAIGTLMWFIADYPDHENASGLWYQIATLYQDEMGDYTHALEAYAKAETAGEAGPEEIGFRRGECYEKMGRIGDALSAYETAAGVGSPGAPFRIASLAQIGQLSEDRGDWPAAIQAYQQIIKADGNPEWTAMAQGRIAEIQANQTAGQ